VSEFSVLSLNTFGIPFFLSGPRIVRLAQELNRLAPAVLCLQEVQQNAYVPLWQRCLAEYPQVAFEWNTLAPKGGLLTAARHPLLHSRFYPYPNRGRLLSIGFSDWALFKGVLLTEFLIEEQLIVIMNTHMHANYTANWTPRGSMARIQFDQVRFLTSLVQAQPDEALVIVCGDFNFPRSTFLYEHLVRNAGLIDPLAEDPRPTYRPFPLVPSRWSIPLDFMLYRPPQAEAPHFTADIIPVEAASARLPTQRFLTDHHALTLTIHWRK
jgi:endonuclease/exonuclease/phosphatase family metal-dependent hydrolase